MKEWKDGRKEGRNEAFGGLTGVGWHVQILQS